MNPKERVRIQKLISNFGSYSRREFEEYIKQGRVQVNNEVATLGMLVSIEDKISLDGKQLKLNTKYDYYLVNKPQGYICAREDKMGKTVISLIDNYKNKNLFTIGRLDVNTTGLIIVTNDGELSHKINSPYSKKKKEYLAWVDKAISKQKLSLLAKGIKLDDGYETRPLKNIKLIKNKDEENKLTLIKLVLIEGKKNQIKRMFEAIDYQVIFLKRTKIEDLNLDGISLGEYKKITKQEIYQRLKI